MATFVATIRFTQQGLENIVTVHSLQTDLGGFAGVGLGWRRDGRTSDEPRLSAMCGLGTQDRGVGGAAGTAGEKLGEFVQASL
jgi:hypothetical protein